MRKIKIDAYRCSDFVDVINLCGQFCGHLPQPIPKPIDFDQCVNLLLNHQLMVYCDTQQRYRRVRNVKIFWENERIVIEFVRARLYLLERKYHCIQYFPCHYAKSAILP